MVNPIEYVEGKMAPEVARITKFEGEDYHYSEMTKFPRAIFNQKEVAEAGEIKAIGMKIANGVFLFALVSQPIGWLFVGAHALLATCGNAWDKYEVKRLSNQQKEIEKEFDKNLENINTIRKDNIYFNGTIEKLQNRNIILIEKHKKNRTELGKRQVVKEISNVALAITLSEKNNPNERSMTLLKESVANTLNYNKKDRKFKDELETQFDCMIKILSSAEIRDSELLFEVKKAKSAIYIPNIQGPDLEHENMIFVRNKALKSLGIDDTKDQKRELRELLQKEKIDLLSLLNEKNNIQLDLLKREIPVFIESLEKQIELIIPIFENESLLNGDYDSLNQKPNNILLVEIEKRNKLFKDINENKKIVYNDAPLKNNLKKIVETRNSILRALGIFDQNDKLIHESRA